MTPARQDARTARKLETSRQQAVQVQTSFKPGTSEHCLADAVLRAVRMAGERVGGLASEQVPLRQQQPDGPSARRVAGAGRYG